jgi:hypothetical protein
LAAAGFRVNGTQVLDPWGTPVRITG